jgi:hypothetical protein
VCVGGRSSNVVVTYTVQCVVQYDNSMIQPVLVYLGSPLSGMWLWNWLMHDGGFLACGRWLEAYSMP